jgi:uroporphyrinogen decarboxylase
MSILLDKLQGKETARPPVWFMRQAGRVLPNYMALRQKYSFKEMMSDPLLCSKITLLPIEDLGVDAAILFSDILVIPEAMGMNLEFTDKGPRFDNALKDRALGSISKMETDYSKLDYIYRNIEQIVKDKGDTPLIGFCGAPLTTLCYMVQGVSSNHTFPEAIKFLYKERDIARILIDKITETSVNYALNQIKSGVQVFQLFESHAGLIPSDLYNELFLPGIKRIAEAVRATGTPFIFFPKGLGTGLGDMDTSMADFVSIDWQMSLANARKIVAPEIGLQGNLDPRLLYSNKENIAEELKKYHKFYEKDKNFIFNLGHGLLPDIPVENVKFVVDQIKSHDWR